VSGDGGVVGRRKVEARILPLVADPLDVGGGEGWLYELVVGNDELLGESGISAISERFYRLDVRCWYGLRLRSSYYLRS